jgi:hypothetical protein
MRCPETLMQFPSGDILSCKANISDGAARPRSELSTQNKVTALYASLNGLDFYEVFPSTVCM